MWCGYYAVAIYVEDFDLSCGRYSVWRLLLFFTFFAHSFPSQFEDENNTLTHRPIHGESHTSFESSQCDVHFVHSDVGLHFRMDPHWNWE